MNAKEKAGREVSGRDTVLCAGPGRSPKVTVELDPTAPDANGRQSIVITHQRNCHGATSLASVAKGVRLRHGKYPTS
jgi:hypothetical protein